MQEKKRKRGGKKSLANNWSGQQEKKNQGRKFWSLKVLEPQKKEGDAFRKKISSERSCIWTMQVAILPGFWPEMSFLRVNNPSFLLD